MKNQLTIGCIVELTEPVFKGSKLKPRLHVGERTIIAEVVKDVYSMGRHMFYFKKISATGYRPDDVLDVFKKIGSRVYGEIKIIALPLDWKEQVADKNRRRRERDDKKFEKFIKKYVK